MITVVGNMKGGTGKSTLAFNLSVWLAHQGHDLILFDLDPQQTLADVVSVRQEENYDPILPMPLQAEALTDLAPDQEILIDVSMSDETGLTAAIELCDQIIIPVSPSQADIWSTQRFIKMIKKIRGDNLPKILGVINRADTHPFVVETKETEEALDFLPHITRLPVRLHNRTNYRRSFSEGLSVFELAPKTKASDEFIKLAKMIFKD